MALVDSGCYDNISQQGLGRVLSQKVRFFI